MKLFTFINKSIRARLTVLFVLASMLPLIVIIFIGLGQSFKIINNEEFNHLESISVFKKNTLVTFFGDAIREISQLQNEEIPKKVIGESTAYLASAISKTKNNEITGELEKIYNTHADYFQNFITAYKFSEIYVVSVDKGIILFNVSHKNNIGSSIIGNNENLVNLTDLWSEIVKTKKTIITDYKLQPETKLPEAFIGSPVFNTSGDCIAVVIIELNTQLIAQIMEDKAGLGESGETYLIGKDGINRSNLRYLASSAILKNKVETQSATLGINGKEGKHIIENYNSTKVLSIYTPLGLDKSFDTDFDWVLISEIKETEAYTAFLSLIIQMIVISLIILIVVVIVSSAVSKRFTQPLFQLKKIAQQIAEGDLVTVTTIKREDEIGHLADSFTLMRENLRKQMEEIYEGTHVLSSSSAQLMSTISELASSSVETASSISETTTTVEEVKQTVDIATQRANEVAESAQRMYQVSYEGKNSVQKSIEGMNKIKQQMESIASIVIRLSEKSNAIGEIAINVNDLAEQSNLLAVNASIEAAKAGEQGKGFSVVAQEIKNLAHRSKDSTQQIRTIISDIQKEIGRAVMATEQGVKVIDSGIELTTKASDVISVLAENVEHASEANIQIASSSHEQLVGMDQIAVAMENIKEASTQAMEGTRQTEQSVSELKRLGEKLLQILKQYKLQ